MTRQELISIIRKKRSFLCIGLDTDLDKVPPHLLEKEDPIFEFNKAIIDATHDLAVAYKPNIAFYEAYGTRGWEALEKTIAYLQDKDVFTIADAKRGDIGNTSGRYAKAFLETLNFDSITVAPYMGEDSVSPFLEKEGKWIVLLALTSNKGTDDFQMIRTGNGKYLYERVLSRALEWGTDENIMYVVGATKAEMIAGIRRIVPDHFLLVPGVGAQGGSLEEVAANGLNKDCGLLVNSSRGIIYAGKSTDFADRARHEAMKLQQQMDEILTKAGM
ncbi:MAG: orotidine-5'-phosphate decarboxylase [Bacteroidales bacterium]|jgi:orotidine-5'-phosphate decarboxylase|nr:orotidine-5'-phosphate decarboxylase [Bacteroidales bacterium]